MRERVELIPSLQTDAPKLATLNLAAKLLTLNPQAGILQKLASYALALARWDASYDVRDRGRWLSGLVRGFLKTEDGGEGTEETEAEGDREGGVVLRPEQVRVVLFEGKSSTVDLPLWKDDGACSLTSLYASILINLG
jgi:AP-3 complex subunit beta